MLLAVWRGATAAVTATVVMILLGETPPVAAGDVWLLCGEESAGHFDFTLLLAKKVDQKEKTSAEI